MYAAQRRSLRHLRYGKLERPGGHDRLKLIKV
jgi:hypothetical protein